MTSRMTRSRSRGILDQSPGAATPATVAFSTDALRLRNATTFDIDPLPSALDTHITRLHRKDHRLLLLKQIKLSDPAGQIHSLINDNLDQPLNERSAVLARATSSTLVFAQHEAGTAVCVSPTGLLLTCSHCVAESAAELDRDKDHWLLFAGGRVVRAKCVAWDERRDLALLKVVAAQGLPHGANHDTATFPAITLAGITPRRNTALLCIGHPGSEDLEVDRPGVATNYDVLHISEGRYRGLATGQDVHDNSEIGALKHDCWTYWGHSGAPLINDAGLLIGLHSSWDDQSGMRRGVAWEAIRAFLEEHPIAVEQEPALVYESS